VSGDSAGENRGITPNSCAATEPYLPCHICACGAQGLSQTFIGSAQQKCRSAH
jgi:hypothetical protein